MTGRDIRDLIQGADNIFGAALQVFDGDGMHRNAEDLGVEFERRPHGPGGPNDSLIRLNITQLQI